MIVTTDYSIDRVPPPNLPLAPGQYDSRYQEQFNNVLRLYFNRLDALLGKLHAEGTIDGSGIQLPNGSFYQDGYTTLTASMTNVSTSPIQVVSTTNFANAGALVIGSELITYTGKTSTTFTGITREAFGSTKSAHSIGDAVTEALGVSSPTSSAALPISVTTESHGVAIDATDKTKIVHSVAGIYNVQFSVQLLTYATAIDNVTIWFRQNGVDIPFSAGIVTVPSKHGSSPGATIVSWNNVLSLNAGDYLQIIFASDTGETVVATYPPGAAPVHPVSPSLIVTSTFVSALY